MADATAEDSSTAEAQAAVAPTALPAVLETIREDGGALDWGFKASWRNYLRFAGGAQMVFGGATLSDEGIVHYPESAESTFDPAAGTGTIAYTGGVNFLNEAHGFSIVMQNPRIEIAADGSAVLSAEMSVDAAPGAEALQRVVIATIAATGAATEADGLSAWSDVAGTFADTIIPAELGQYGGQAADSLSFSTPAATTPEIPDVTWSPEVRVFLGDSVTPLAAGAKVYKGDKLTVKGTGFDPEANIGGRGMPIPSTLPQGSYVVFGKFAAAWSPADGVSSKDRKVGPQGWVLAENVLDQVPAQYQAMVRNQWVPLAADGSWTAELTLAEPKDAATISGDYGVYTYGAGGVNNQAQEFKLGLDYTDTERPKGWSPEVRVFLGDSVTPLAAGAKVYKGDKLTVKGTGFDPEANIGGRGMPIPSTLPQGSYVVFGKFAAAWSPADGVSSKDRKVGPQGWVLAENVLDQVPAQYQAMVRNQWVPLAADGSWTAELTLAEPKDAATISGDYGVYTYGAGGVNNQAQEFKLGLDYTDTERPNGADFEPSITVYQADGVTELGNTEVTEGDTLVVKGTGFDPYANLGGLGQPIPADKPQGTFVVFGNFAEQWKPSEGVKSDQRKMDKSNRGWALAADTLENDVPDAFREEVRGQWVELDPATGSFTWTVTLKQPAELVKGGKFGIYSYAGGVNTANPAQELRTVVNFKSKTEPENPDPKPTTGGLQWGIKDSFRSYIESNSDGKVGLSGNATRTGNIFNFPQLAGGEWNSRAETGEVRYAGGVSFSAHGGALSFSLADPVIKVSDARTAVLYATYAGKQTAIADLHLADSGRSDSGAAAARFADLGRLVGLRELRDRPDRQGLRDHERCRRRQRRLCLPAGQQLVGCGEPDGLRAVLGGRHLHRT